LNNPPYWAYVTITDALKVLNNGDLARNDPSKLNLPSNRLIWENYSSDRTLSTGNRLGQANRMLHINARDYNSSSYYDPVSRTFGYVCPDSPVWRQVMLCTSTRLLSKCQQSTEGQWAGLVFGIH
jgi:hypothetical protein